MQTIREFSRQSNAIGASIIAIQTRLNARKRMAVTDSLKKKLDFKAMSDEEPGYWVKRLRKSQKNSENVGLS